MAQTAWLILVCLLCLAPSQPHFELVFDYSVQMCWSVGSLSLQVRKKPKEWIPDAVWLNIVALSNMEAFRDIPDSVFRNDGLWRQWYDQEAPEMAKVCNRAAHQLQSLSVASRPVLPSSTQ